MDLLVVLAVALLVLVLFSRRGFPRAVDLAEARRRQATDAAPVVVFRPSCSFCVRLRLGLGRRARLAHWVDVREDPEASELVRSATGGDETVPSVLHAGHVSVNPPVGWVRERLPLSRR